MSEEPQDKDKSPEQTAPSPDSTKTPLDNLKNILSQVESSTQKEEKSSSQEAQPPTTEPQSPPQQENKSEPTIAKKEILEVLERLQNISEEVLSPRQVDIVLRPLFESKQPPDIKKFLEEGMETEAMGVLKTILTEFKAKQSEVS